MTETNTQPVAGGQGYILTGDPGDKATGILSGGGEIVLATIPTGATQAVFYAPPNVSHVRLDAAAAARASLMSFNGAPGGFAASGGGTPAPLPRGLAYVPGIPSTLAGDTIYDIYPVPAVLDLSALACEWSGRVETCELWMTLDAGGVPVITFPGAWVWPDGLPSIDTPGKSYRIAVRREPYRIVANLAYSA